MGSQVHGVALAAQSVGNKPANSRVVVDHEHVRIRHRETLGSMPYRSLTNALTSGDPIHSASYVPGRGACGPGPHERVPGRSANWVLSRKVRRVGGAKWVL